MLSSLMSFLRDSFSFVRVLTALFLAFTDKTALPDFTNDSLQYVNVIGSMLCLQHSSAGVMCVFIDSTIIRTFSSGAWCGFSLTNPLPKE